METTKFELKFRKFFKEGKEKTTEIAKKVSHKGGTIVKRAILTATMEKEDLEEKLTEIEEGIQDALMNYGAVIIDNKYYLDNYYNLRDKKKELEQVLEEVNEDIRALNEGQSFLTS
jgi:hypothetical protein